MGNQSGRHRYEEGSILSDCDHLTALEDLDLPCCRLDPLVLGQSQHGMIKDPVSCPLPSGLPPLATSISRQGQELIPFVQQVTEYFLLSLIAR
jgi:hypothetical protein